MSEALKPSRNFENARLLAADFDGTIARTFEPSPNEIDVHRAYDIAVGRVFTQGQLSQYREDGGLQNRAPSEVVRSVMPDAPVDELAEATREFVDAKLAVLLDEITDKWPRPMPGYLETREAIAEANAAGEIIDEAIVSSGHVPFIEKTYETWGQPIPQHIVAEETIRDLALSLSIEPPVKPHPELMRMTHQLWRGGYAVHEHNDEHRRTLYVGDDMEKDGMLAQNSETDFVLIDSEKPAESWRRVRARLNIGEEIR